MALGVSVVLVAAAGHVVVVVVAAVVVTVVVMAVVVVTAVMAVDVVTAEVAAEIWPALGPGSVSETVAGQWPRRPETTGSAWTPWVW